MKSDAEMLRCCVCNTPVHTETHEGYISSKLHRAFCGVNCENIFNPKIHGVRHHVPQNTPGQRKKFREHEELKEVFEFLRNEDKSSTSYDDELVERELIPLEEYFEELKKMHASQACVVL